MTHSLTRRNISAIASLSFADMSHSQRIDAIAKAIGYANGASLMATTKAAEKQPTQKIRAVAIYGTSMVNAVYGNQPLVDQDGDAADGDITELEFQTQAELDAYFKGMTDADGWDEQLLYSDAPGYETSPYFEEAKTGFKEWYIRQSDND